MNHENQEDIDLSTIPDECFVPKLGEFIFCVTDKQIEDRVTEVHIGGGSYVVVIHPSVGIEFSRDILAASASSVSEVEKAFKDIVADFCRVNALELPPEHNEKPITED